MNKEIVQSLDGYFPCFYGSKRKGGRVVILLDSLPRLAQRLA